MGQKTLFTDYVIDDVVKTSTENGNYFFDGLTATYLIDVVLRGMIPDMLVHLGFPEAALSFVEPCMPLISLTFVARYQGDEELTPETC